MEIRLVLAGLTIAMIVAGCAGNRTWQNPVNTCTDTSASRTPPPASENSGGDLDEFNSAYRAFNTALEEGSPTEALKHISKAIESGKPLLAPEKIAKLEHSMANTLTAAGKHDEAHEVFQCLIEPHTEIFGQDSVELASLHLELARLSRLRLDRPAERRELRFRSHVGSSIDIMKRATGEDSKQYADHLFAIADILSSTRGKDSRIEQYYTAALEGYRRALGPDDPAIGLTAYKLGESFLPRASGSETAASKSEEYLLLAVDILKGAPDLAERLIKSRHLLMLSYAVTEQREKVLQQCLELRKLRNTPGFDDDTTSYDTMLRVKPRYPRPPALSGTEGHAAIEFDLNELGKPHNIHVVEYEGSELFGKASVEAIRQSQWPPLCDEQQLTTIEGMEVTLSFNIAK